MPNEMGNQNATGIVEKHKEGVVDSEELGKEIHHFDDLTAENGMVSEGKSEDFDGKLAENSVHETPSDEQPSVKKQISEEDNGQVISPSDHLQNLEEENGLVMEERDDIQAANLPNIESHREETMESTLEESLATLSNGFCYEFHDQTESFEGELGRNDLDFESASTKPDINPKPEDNLINAATESSLGIDCDHLFKEAEETLEMSTLGHVEEKHDLIGSEMVENLDASVVFYTNDNKGAEKIYETSSNADEVENGFESTPPEMESSDSTDSNLADVQRVDLLNLSDVVFEEQNACLQPDEESKSNATQSIKMIDHAGTNSSSSVGLIHVDQEAEVRDTRDQDRQAVNTLRVFPIEEMKDDEGVIETEMGNGFVPMEEPITTAYCPGETDKKEEGKMMKGESCKIGNDSEIKRAIENFVMETESSTHIIDSALACSTVPLKSQYVNDPELGFEVAQNGEKSKDCASLETSFSNADINQNPLSEITLIGQTMHNELTEYAELSKEPDEQLAKCMTISCSDVTENQARENVEGLTISSKSEQVGNKGESRKWPSFDFGLKIDARSEESDQTPLLYLDKSATATTRSLSSSCATMRYQNIGMQTEYYLLQNEAEDVAEKTIRMERSNSENFNIIPKMKDEKQGHVLDDLGKSPSKQLALTSPKGTGKRRQRSSLFTTCICCTAAIS